MPPQPKRKYPKARQGERRSHLGVEKPSIVLCSQCHSPKKPHHVCLSCGTYNGREVIKVKTPKASS